MRLVVALLAAVLALAPVAEAQTVKIGTTPSFIFLPIYAAAELGYFKGEGLSIQFVDFEGGAEVTTAMVGGSIDAGGTMAERPLMLAEKGFGAKNLVARETLALRFATLMAQDHHKLDDGFFRELRGYFTDAEIIELGLVTGQFIGFGRLVAALDLENPRPPEA